EGPEMTHEPQNELPPELREYPAESPIPTEAPRRGRRVGPLVAMTLALLLAVGGVFALPFNVGGAWTQPTVDFEQATLAKVAEQTEGLQPLCGEGVDPSSVRVAGRPAKDVLFVVARTPSGALCGMAADPSGTVSLASRTPNTPVSGVVSLGPDQGYLAFWLAPAAAGASGFRSDFKLFSSEAESSTWSGFGSDAGSPA
ncbi:hypothetical protein, partial [Leucobacter sp. OLTLW20]